MPPLRWCSRSPPPGCLQVEGAAFAYRGGQTLFSGLDVTLATGEVLCVLEPNGVGRSTPLRCLAGLERLSAGTIEIANGTVSPGRATGFVPQSDAPVFAFDVRTVVEMGRAPHLSWTSMPDPRDATIVERAMTRLGITHLVAGCVPS